jgi:hypothetical protein
MTEEESAGRVRPKRKVPEDDPEYRWLQDPPIYCDHYSAQLLSSKVVRVSFGEYIGKNYFPIYRVAIAMPLSDIKDLHASLGRIIKTAEEDAKKEDDSSEK